MNKQKFLESVNLINKIVSKYDSMRQFAKAIYESPSDVSRWCSGKLAVKPRAVLEICRLHREIIPHDLNHMAFSEDLRVSYIKEIK